MNCVRRLAVVAVSLLLASGTASAVPLYYTFSGTVSFASGDTGGVSGGDSVTYTFLADFTADGGVTIGGTFFPYTDISGTDYFYAEYIGGSHIPRPPAGSTQSFTYGTNRPFDSYGDMFGSATDDYYNYVVVYTSSAIASNWTIGQSLVGDDYFAIEGDSGRVVSELRLTSISDTPPNAVPEPATLFLLGSGIIGLAVRPRKRA